MLDIFRVGLTIASVLFVNTLHALEANEIVKKAIHASYYQGNDGKAKVDMRIIDEKGRERYRKLTMLRTNQDEVDGEQKYYVYFNKPSDVKKMVFMAWKNIGAEDDRWLYLPALDLVKRIAASDERTSFVGSDFYYEDVSGRSINEDNHALIKETDEYYVIKSVPKKPADVEFSFYKNWVDKITFLPMKAEYYNGSNVVYRQYHVDKVETIDGYPTVIVSQMKNNLIGSKTVLTYSSVRFDAGLPNSIYTERYLRRPPKKHLR